MRITTLFAVSFAVVSMSHLAVAGGRAGGADRPMMQRNFVERAPRAERFNHIVATPTRVEKPRAAGNSTPGGSKPPTNTNTCVPGTPHCHYTAPVERAPSKPIVAPKATTRAGA